MIPLSAQPISLDSPFKCNLKGRSWSEKEMFLLDGESILKRANYDLDKKRWWKVLNYSELNYCTFCSGRKVGL